MGDPRARGPREHMPHDIGSHGSGSHEVGAWNGELDWSIVRQGQPRSGSREAAITPSRPHGSVHEGSSPAPGLPGARPSEGDSSASRRQPERGDTARRVATRWAGSGSGERYGTQRFRSRRARERDPALLRSLLSGRPLPELPVLDAPSGAGRMRPTLFALSRPVVSLDVSDSMLGEVGSGGAGRIRGSALALPFQDATFGLVVCCRLLHHLGVQEEREQLLAELGRVSQRWVALSYWDAASWHAWRRRRGWRHGHDRRVAMSAGLLEGIASKAGLRLVARRFSLRFVSPQSWALFERVGTRP